jgi:hypothetical protein
MLPLMVYARPMNSLFHLDVRRHSPAMRRFVTWAWTIIIAKCGVVAWAIAHWQVPVSPYVIIVPTLAMASLATFLWIVHEES